MPSTSVQNKEIPMLSSIISSSQSNTGMPLSERFSADTNSGTPLLHAKDISSMATKTMEAGLANNKDPNINAQRYSKV